MIFVDRATGHCRQSSVPPGPQWLAVDGNGALFRRREKTGWRAEHAYAPDARIWISNAWERVRLRPAAAQGPVVRGPLSGLKVAFAPPIATDAASADAVWVVLPDEPGLEAPAERPGTQALFSLRVLREGAAAPELAEKLLARRILGTGLELDAALWILRGPPVSPDDARILRRLHPILALATRLASDLETIALAYVPPPRAESSAPSPRRPGRAPARATIVSTRRPEPSDSASQSPYARFTRSHGHDGEKQTTSTAPRRRRPAPRRPD